MHEIPIIIIIIINGVHAHCPCPYRCVWLFISFIHADIVPNAICYWFVLFPMTLYEINSWTLYTMNNGSASEFYKSSMAIWHRHTWYNIFNARAPYTCSIWIKFIPTPCTAPKVSWMIDHTYRETDAWSFSIEQMRQDVFSRIANNRNLIKYLDKKRLKCSEENQEQQRKKNYSENYYYDASSAKNRYRTNMQ